MALDRVKLVSTVSFAQPAFDSGGRSMTRSIALMIESDGPGGAEHVVLELAEELRRRHYEVCPVGPHRGSGWLAEQFLRRGFSPEVFVLQRSIDPFCVVDLARKLKKRGVTAIHSHEFTMAVYGTATARRLRVPHVITMHGGLNYRDRWRRRVALRWAMKRSIGVAVSGSAARELERTLRLPPNSVPVVLNGISYHPGDRDRGRRNLGLESPIPLILAVGNLYPVKGHIFLLQGLAALQRRRPELPWACVIAGRGDQQDILNRFIQDEGLGARVRLLGFREDVPDLLAAADIYTMPSLSEGMPLALMEAMFAEKAIVASAVGGIPEVVHEGRDAVLVPAKDGSALGEAIERLLSLPALRKALGEAAAARARARYHVGGMVAAYEPMYEGVRTL